MSLPTRRTVSFVVCSVALVSLASACTDKAKTVTNVGRDITVVSTDKACTLSSANAPSGTVTFAVENTGSQVTEFYVYGADGKRIIGEVENLGPGTTRKLVVIAKPGAYITACKPGATGDGIRAAFTVTG